MALLLPHPALILMEDISLSPARWLTSIVGRKHLLVKVKFYQQKNVLSVSIKTLSVGFQ